MTKDNGQNPGARAATQQQRPAGGIRHGHHFNAAPGRAD